ncbi:hypothetical protein KJ780_02795 [Candidatus Micrarchaeota archaeon]|nr:hypothetical protein [Candidatus Micrarchaeota archaeon]
MDWKLLLRLLLVFLLLIMLYSIGMPINYLILLGILFLLVVLLREHIYEKIDKILIRIFPFISKWPQWIRALLVLLLFILAYALLKQLIFELLKIMGMDIQQSMVDSINNSLK